MKSLVKITGLLICFVGILTIGCKKEIIKEVIPSSEKKQKLLTNNIIDGITVTNGILTFSTFDVYEQFIENFSPDEDGVIDEIFEESMAYLQTLDYISLYTQKLDQEPLIQEEIDSLYDSEFIQNILNRDYLVIIGDFIFKINAATERVYTMELNAIDYIDELINENIETGRVQEFYTEDDVFEKLNESGYEYHATAPTKMQKARCGETACAGTGLKGISDIGRNGHFQVQTTIKYIKLGIYFEVSARVLAYFQYPLYPVYENPKLYVTLSLQRKCKSLINYGMQTINGERNIGMVKKTLYSCAIPLSKINFSAFGGCKMPFPIVYLQTPEVSFRRNL